MSDIKMSRCSTCGFEWATGKHGGHSCFIFLQGRIKELEVALQEIIDLPSVREDEGWRIASDALDKQYGVVRRLI